MKKVRMFCVFFATVMILLLTGLGSSETKADSTSIPGEEYERGIWYGFLPEELADADADSTIVTWRQYCDMMGNMIEKYQPESLTEWESMTRNAPDTEMKRDGAMIALLFAAETVGLNEFNGNLEPRFDSYSPHDHASFDYPVFDWEQPCYITATESDEYNYIGPSYVFCLKRRSTVTMKSLLTDTDGDGDLHLDQPLTLRDAMLSVIRLYESDEQIKMKHAEMLLEQTMQTEEAAQIAAEADARKTEILNSETKIVKSDTFVQGETYTGTAYYVSNNGDDNADGKSPETAWATFERLAAVEFQFGDAIFFERGSTWRKTLLPYSIRGTQGLTLSAYGEGEKPQLFGSPENGTGAEKWSLYYEGDNGEKIWKFNTEMTDCAAIVLNGGESYCKRSVPFWTGETLTDYYDHTKPYVMEEQLKDMELFSSLPYEELPHDINYDTVDMAYVIDWDDEAGVSVYLEGPVYLRCDAGNPGELYDSIEFVTGYAAADGFEDYTTLDNLCISYAMNLCAGSVDGDSTDYATYQYCEISWIGGCLKYFSDQDDMCMGYVWMDGGGVNVNGSYENIHDNYVHHCFQEGIGLETFEDDNDPCTNVTIKDNVVEYCVMGLTVINWDEHIRGEHLMDDILVENNYVLYSGFENYYNVAEPVLDEYNGADIGHYPAEIRALVINDVLDPYDGNITIRNNTFAFSANSLVTNKTYTAHNCPSFEGNTYAQLPGLAWAAVQSADDPDWDYITVDTFVLSPEEAMQKYLFDNSAKIITFEEH